MKIRTLNKRRKRLNKYKMFLLAHMYAAIKTIKSKDYLITETPGFRMYVNHLHYIYKSKRYKQFYYEMKQGEEITNKKKDTERV